MTKLVKLNKNLDVVVKSQIVNFLNPDIVYVPIEKNSKILVKQNSNILKESIVIKTNDNKKISSVSGTVIGKKKVTINNEIYDAIAIQNNYEEKKLLEKNDSQEFTRESIIEKLYEYGYQNIANILENKKIKNIVINAVDDEPYIYNSGFIADKNAKEVLKILDVLVNNFNIKKSLIVLKNNDTKNAEKFLSLVGTYPGINISLVEDYYLISKSFFLLDYLNIKETDTIVIDIESLINIYNSLFYHKYPLEKVITISGPVLEKSLVIKTKIGTSIKEIIDKNIKLKTKNVIYILNSMLSGNKIDINSEIVNDITKGIIVLENVTPKSEKCQNCGLCLKICPVKINPKKVMDTKKINSKCLDCGLCTYICPSYINLRKYLNGDFK